MRARGPVAVENADGKGRFAEGSCQYQPSVRPPLTYGEGELPTYTLGPDLDRLLSPEDRQVGAPRLALPPTLREASLSRNRLTLKVSIDEGPASPSDSSAWQRGFPAGPILLILGPEASRAGSALTFKISARRPLPR